MKNWFGRWILSACVIAMLTACGGGGDDPPGYTSDPTGNNNSGSMTWRLVSSDYKLNGVAWSGPLSMYVAVGEEGTIVTSSDGETWTLVQSVPSACAYNDVVWGDGQFVAVGCGVHTSPNGINWTSQTLWTDLNDLVDDIESVKWTGTEYLIAGTGYASNSYVFNSPDAVTWTEHSVPAYYVKDVESSGSLYVAVDHYGKIFTSTDLDTWTKKDTTSYWLECVIWDGARFIAAGYGGSLLISTNGVDWTERYPGWSAGLFDILWDGSRYLTYGNSLNIFSSTDLINWKANGNGPTDTFFGGASNGGTQYVLVGSLKGSIMVSP